MRGCAVWIAAAAATAMPAWAAHWNVEPSSKLGFSVIWGGEPLTGSFKRWTADIEFDPSDLAHSRVVATIETGSVVTDYPEGDEGLKGNLGFDIGQFPTARFETTGFRRLPDGSFVAGARLTIRGITKPLQLPFKLSVQGNHAHVTGRAGLIRTDFGVGQGEWAAPEPVAHQVTVTLDLSATKS